MGVESCLRGYLDSIYLTNPGATTREVVADLRARLGIVPVAPDADELTRCLGKIFDLGLASAWRAYYREARREAIHLIRGMAIRKTEDGDVIELLLQTKLTLPDADAAPVLGDSTVLQLQRASAYLRRMQRSVGEQAKRLEELATQLARASMLAGKPDLTINEAQAAKLIDWRYLHAA